MPKVTKLMVHKIAAQLTTLGEQLQAMVEIKEEQLDNGSSSAAYLDKINEQLDTLSDAADTLVDLADTLGGYE